MSVESLQQRTVLCGGARRHHYEGAMPLSVKTFRGGVAHYRTARGCYAVHEGDWLVINDGERYALDFESDTPVRSTVVFFPAGWAAAVARVFREREQRLLDSPGVPGSPVEFLETVMSRDERVIPCLRELDAACRRRRASGPWLEEKLRDLLAAMILSQRDHRARAGRLPASRAATREELFRRVCRGRDFLGATACDAPSLTDAARVAALSPYHFQRSFTAVFGESPHAFAIRCRLEHARHLLAARRPVADVALAVGYGSYSAFHHAFTRRFGAPPAGFARKRRPPAEDTC
ncbi:MAG: hypothetical protein C0502_06955 [Opitutus sp.]|nr:hypothetical protein [Opitutus sp.]